MKTQDNEGLDLENIINQVDLPFTDEIMQEKVPPKFKLPTTKLYYGSKDPIEHLDTFQSCMELYRIRDAIKCRSFYFPLIRSLTKWFCQLKQKSISSFRELAHYQAG